MPHRATHEVIDGVNVIRYNGNNISGSRAEAEKGRFGQVRFQKIQASAKAKARKRVKETDYKRRYLGGT